MHPITHHTRTHATMCIFSAPVVRVSATKIFVCPLSSTTQFSVYSNTVALGATPTAMILPFPVSSAARYTDANPAARMFDMNAYKGDLFEDLDSLFLRHPTPMTKGAGTRGGAYQFMSNAAPLPVFACGDYQYSVANTLQDLARLQNDTFRLQGNVGSLLSTHYQKGFGFLVCICKKSGAYKPIAYMHPLVNGTLFVPTMHDHPHEEDEEDWDGRRRPSAWNRTANDWDHTVYIQGSVEPQAQGAPTIGYVALTTAQGTRIDTEEYSSAHEYTVLNHNQAHVKTHLLPQGFPISSPGQYLRKYLIHGAHGNGDLLIRSYVWLEQATSKGCTRLTTGKNAYYVQPFYHCRTCDLTDANNKGVCTYCRMTVCKNHDVQLGRVGGFFCDHGL